MSRGDLFSTLTVNLDKVLFAIILAMAALIGFLLTVPEAPGGHGFQHPDFSTMWHGSERHGALLWVGWAFGVLFYMFAFTLAALGARQRDRLRGVGPRLFFGFVGCVAVWTFLIFVYRDYSNEVEHNLFLTLPAPTAVMLFGLFPSALVFSLSFSIGFKRWVYSDEDAAAYERVLRDRRQRQAAAEPGDRSTPSDRV